MNQKKIKKILLKFLKVIGWSIGSLIVLLLLLILLIRLPAVQSKIVTALTDYVQKKTDTVVTLDRAYISFFTALTLEELYVETPEGDTLVYLGELDVSTNLLSLLDNEINLSHIELHRATINLRRPTVNGDFNYNFLIEAFAAEDSTATEESGAAWAIEVGNVHLQDIHLVYEDALSGLKAASHIKAIEAEVEVSDIERMAFEVETLGIHGVRGSLYLWEPDVPASLVEKEALTETDENVSSGFALALEQLAIQDVRFTYNDSSQRQTLDVALGSWQTEGAAFESSRQLVRAELIALANSDIHYHQKETIAQDKDSLMTTTESAPMDNDSLSEATLPWQVSIGKLRLEKNSLRYDDDNAAPLEEGFDPKHIFLNPVTLLVNAIEYKGETASLQMEQFHISDKSGLTITQLAASVGLEPQGLNIDNLVFSTPHSHLESTLSMTFPGLDEIMDRPEDTQLSFLLENTTLAVQDLLYFQPDILDSLPLQNAEELALSLAIQASGSMENLKLDKVKVRLEDALQLEVEGRLDFPLDMEHLSFTIDPLRLDMNTKSLQAWLPDSLLPQSLRLPPNVALNTIAKGDLHQIKADGGLASSFGDMTFIASYQDSMAGALSYSAQLGLQGMDLGKILRMDSTLGKLHLSASAKGRTVADGLLDHRIKVNMKSLDYNDYEYTDLLLKGSLLGSEFDGKLHYADSSLAFDYKGVVDFNDTLPSIDFTFDLRKADLQALNFYDSLMKVRLRISADLQTDRKERLEGNLSLRDFSIQKSDRFYDVDSLLFVSVREERRKKINIDSDIMNISFEGTMHPLELPKTLQKHVRPYLGLPDTLNAATPREDFKFDITVTDPSLFTDILVPGLDSLEVATIAGEFDSGLDILRLTVDIPKLSYSGMVFDSLNVDINGEQEQLSAIIRNRALKSGDFAILKTELAYLVRKGQREFHVRLPYEVDSTELRNLDISGEIIKDSTGIQLDLAPEIVLGQKVWAVASEHQLKYTKKGLLLQAVSFTHDTERIGVDTDADSVIQLSFDNFSLAAIGSLLSDSLPLISGGLNGTASLNTKSTTDWNWRSTISIEDLAYQTVPLGNLSAKIADKNQSYNAEIALSGANDLKTKMVYRYGDEPYLDLNASLNHFDLHSLQPFIDDFCDDMQGKLTGEVRTEGSLEKPDIDGNLRFQEAKFHLNMLNVDFLMDDEQITFNRESILMDNFTIKDEKGQALRIDGKLGLEDIGNIGLDLRLNADDFMVMNSSKEDSDLYYGKVLIDSKMEIKGDQALPKINGDLKIIEGSELTYVIPQDGGDALQAEGIVEFYDASLEKDTFFDTVKMDAKDTLGSTLQGFSLSTNISVDEKSLFKIIIDPITGDQLTIRGNGDLAFSLSALGDMRLSGHYQIASGDYRLNFYSLVKRRFDILEGSSIAWTGDVLEADMDITAQYRLETSPPLARNLRPLPFLVNINLDGSLLKPEISFDLGMPESIQRQYSQVYNRLQSINQQQTELNKQVFSLIVLNSFMMESNTSVSAEGRARSSVSQILSQQLNKLSNKIEGVNLSLDLNSYETLNEGDATGQTDLELGLSKTFLDNRLSIKLSGNVNLEGQENASNDFSDIAGDLVLEYKLTEDGRYRLKGFREKNYDGLIQEEVVETGVGIIMVRDYNAFKELFSIKNKENQ